MSSLCAAQPMNTPTHMLIGAAVFARTTPPSILIAALLGGLVSDLPLFVMVLWATRVVGLPDNEVFGQLYFSDDWQAILSVDHSLLVWSALIAIASWRGNAILRSFAGASLLHAAADFLTHKDDARRQLWPNSDWVFHSPVSYWDSRFYGGPFAVFEVGLTVGLAVFLCWRFKRPWQRVLVLIISAPLIFTFLRTGSVPSLHGMG